MNKFFIFLLSCFLFISCASIPKMTPEEKQIQKEYEDAEEPTFNIKWDTTYIDPSEGLDGYLEIKNPKTGTIVRITYKDFFIMKRAYKNWRSIENGTPVITNVEESGQYVVVTFNYFDNESKIWSFSEMDADHVSAWSKGGKSNIKNCQMLCITHNRAKGNR